MTMDGTYKADGRTVRKSPRESKTGISIGFPVCELTDFVGDEAAQIIADALNEHRAAHPEQH